MRDAVRGTQGHPSHTARGHTLIINVNLHNSYHRIIFYLPPSLPNRATAAPPLRTRAFQSEYPLDRLQRHGTASLMMGIRNTQLSLLGGLNA